MNKFIFIILYLISFHCFAQIKIGIESGFSITNFRGSKFKYADSSINTFQAGIKAEIDLFKSVYLQASLICFGNGSDYLVAPGPDVPYSRTTIRVYYLRLPVNIIYKIKLAKQVNVFAGSGLYAATGLWGNEKGYYHDGFINGSTFHPVNNKVVFRNTTDFPPPDYTSHTIAIKPFDFGYNILAGIGWKSFQLTANFTNGLSGVFANSNNVNSGVSGLKNQAFTIALAYLVSLK